MGRKKNVETLEKERNKLKQEIDDLYKILKDKKAEEEFKKNIKTKQEIIRNDLITQLQEQGKFGKHFEDMVEDYCYFVELKEELQYDLKVNGIRYWATGGNGFSTEKPNESVKNLPTINTQMLKILQVLNLKEPDDNGGDVGDDLL